MSEDPKLFEAGDYNLFRYCHNDPIDFTDPTGLQEAVATHSPQEESFERVKITNAERISLWQKSMESSIGGEWATNALRSSTALEVPYIEKKSATGPSRGQRSYSEYLNDVRAIEGGDPALQSVAFNPLDALSGWLAGLVKGSVRPLAAKAISTRAMWVGKDGLEAATASGAGVMKASETAIRAMQAGDMSIMQAESAAWARGATGYVPVFFGNGAGRTFLNHEFPELLKNMSSGKVEVIDITF
jgi:hypothetical protein